jgi:hypothetical protein
MGELTDLLVTRRAMNTAFRHHVIALLLATLTAGLGACKSKPAAPPPDTKLVISKATWGAMDDSLSSDVTQKVRELVKGDALEVLASSRILGEPAAFKLKELRVDYSKGGVVAKKRATENETLRIAADEKPVPIRLVIRKATYGNLESGLTVDVTKRVGDMVVDNKLTVTPTNALFGDPASFKAKALKVDYSYDGLEKSTTVTENEALSLPRSGS